MVLSPEPAKSPVWEVGKVSAKEEDSLPEAGSGVRDMARESRVSIHNTFNQVDSREIESASFRPSYTES